MSLISSRTWGRLLTQRPLEVESLEHRSMLAGDGAGCMEDSSQLTAAPFAEVSTPPRVAQERPDFNQDNRIDIRDFVILRANFGKTGVSFQNGDTDSDGDVDVVDFTHFRKFFRVDPVVGFAQAATEDAGSELAPVSDNFAGPPAAPAVRVDFNGNGRIDIPDFVILRRNFGRTVGAYGPGDTDGDGDVDVIDFKNFRTIIRPLVFPLPSGY